MTGETTNDRVTNKQLYEVIRIMERDTSDKLVAMERRLTDKLEPIAAACSLVIINKEEIDKLRTRSDRADRLVGALSIAAAAIAGFFGVKT